MAKVAQPKKGRLKEDIYQLIRNDIPLRIKISEGLGVIESSVYGAAKRKAPVLEKYIVIKIIMEYTEKSEEEIFETE